MPNQKKGEKTTFLCPIEYVLMIKMRKNIHQLKSRNHYSHFVTIYVTESKVIQWNESILIVHGMQAKHPLVLTFSILYLFH